MRALGLVLALAATATVASAQEQWRLPSTEIRPFAGVFVPVGASRADFKSATMVGAQAAMELNRHFHGLASLGWTHGHNKFFARDRTDIWQYDVGAEVNAVRDLGWGWYVRPFLGAGAGGRSYNYRDTAKTTHCTAGYGTLGTELQRNVVALRVEARDYLSCFESPITEKKRTRNDLALSIGFAYHLR